MTENFKKYTIVRDGYVYNFYENYKQPVVDQMVAYAQMAKRFMNKPFGHPNSIVGNYEWHQEFPYEEHLGFDFERNEITKVIDFGCGPGRMVERAEKMFNHVDGIDISEYAIAYAREHRKGNFYVSSGIDVGDAPDNRYDMVYSTIAMQHIPVKTIRMNILRGMYNILKPGGRISLQVAYAENQQAGVWSPDTEHASYESDFWNAKATNGHADMVINKESLPLFINDLSDIFSDVSYELVDVASKYNNLNGRYHAPYWADSWLFVKGSK